MTRAAVANNLVAPARARETPARRSHTIGYGARPHWIVFIPLATAFAATFLIYLVLRLAIPEFAPLAIMPLVACCVFALWRVPGCLRFRLRVTDRLVSVRTGRSGSRALGIELEEIQSVAVTQSPLGKRLGYGDVRIKHSGGTCVIRGLKDPFEFRCRVRNAVFSLHRDIMESLETSAAAAN